MQIAIEKLTKTYHGKTVLSLDSLRLESGKIHGILGPNGSGKTTLMKSVAGLLAPTSGVITYNGLPGDEAVLKKLTYASHTPYLFAMSVYDNIAYPLKIRKYGKAAAAPIVEGLLREFKIEEIAKQNAKKLSGGESQKTALARALSFSPDTLLLDEPTANIDPQSLKIIEAALIKRNREAGLTVIIITHNPSQAYRICDSLSFLDSGRLLFNGSVKAFKASKNPVIRDFITLN